MLSALRRMCCCPAKREHDKPSVSAPLDNPHLRPVSIMPNPRPAPSPVPYLPPLVLARPLDLELQPPRATLVDVPSDVTPVSETTPPLLDGEAITFRGGNTPQPNSDSEHTSESSHYSTLYG